jgi:hypothetical protein
MIPLIIYVLPYLIVPLRKNFRLISFLAWLIVFSYVCVIGFSIYTKYYVNGHLIDIKALTTFTPPATTDNKADFKEENAELIEENLDLKKQIEELKEKEKLQLK